MDPVETSLGCPICGTHDQHDHAAHADPLRALRAAVEADLDGRSHDARMLRAHARTLLEREARAHV